MAGVPKQGPGDRQPLALTAGELHPAFSHFGVVALFETLDEFGGVRRLGGLADPVVADFSQAVGDVVPDGAGQERAVLGHITDQRPPRHQIELGHVLISPADGSGFGLVKAFEEGKDCGFPRRQKDRRSRSRFPGSRRKLRFLMTGRSGT